MRRPIVALAAALALPTACGSDDSGTTTLTVSAASSLRPALTAYAERFDGARARLSFAGSDELAAQIRQGARPDVFASADVEQPDALHAAGLVERPVVVARNRLVIAVAADAERIESINDLARPGVTLAIGSESVPVGRYARAAIAQLGPERSRAVLANVRSNEPDVGGVVGKLTQGAVDAGFVYATDVAAARGQIRAIELPRELRTSAPYGVAVVTGGRNPEAARRFVAGLRDGPGAQILRETGFEAP
jgi:molybdate transport system substrate-binding protein